MSEQPPTGVSITTLERIARELGFEASEVVSIHLDMHGAEVQLAPEVNGHQRVIRRTVTLPRTKREPS